MYLPFIGLWRPDELDAQVDVSLRIWAICLGDACHALIVQMGKNHSFQRS